MQILQEKISVHALVGAKILESFREKSIILFAPTSTWMHVGRAMQEQRSGVPRADAPTKHCTKDAE